jgi:hypothetical protein
MQSIWCLTIAFHQRTAPTYDEKQINNLILMHLLSC